MPSAMNISVASAARSTAAETVSRSSGSKPAEHVIRHVARDSSPRPTPDPHARKRLRAERLNHRLQPVVPAGAAPRRARNRPSGSATSSVTTNTSAGSIL